MLNTITDAIHSLAPNISVVITVVLLYLGKKTADKLVDEVLKDLIASGKKFLEKRKQKRQQSLRKQIIPLPPLPLLPFPFFGRRMLIFASSLSWTSASSRSFCSTRTSSSASKTAAIRSGESTTTSAGRSNSGATKEPSSTPIDESPRLYMHTTYPRYTILAPFFILCQASPRIE